MASEPLKIKNGEKFQHFTITETYSAIAGLSVGICASMTIMGSLDDSPNSPNDSLSSPHLSLYSIEDVQAAISHAPASDQPVIKRFLDKEAIAARQQIQTLEANPKAINNQENTYNDLEMAAFVGPMVVGAALFTAISSRWRYRKYRKTQERALNLELTTSPHDLEHKTARNLKDLVSYRAEDWEG